MAKAHRVKTVVPAATVDVSFDGTNVHFSFGIPQGEQGAPGDVNTPQMDAATRAAKYARWGRAVQATLMV